MTKAFRVEGLGIGVLGFRLYGVGGRLGNLGFGNVGARINPVSVELLFGAVYWTFIRVALDV